MSWRIPLRLWHLALAALIAYVLAVGSAAGMVTQTDPSGFEAGSAFSMVGYLSTGDGATGVLIGDRHVLTARHAVSDIEGQTFTLGGSAGLQTFDLASAVLHPTADLAIIELDASTGLPGYRLYDGPVEVGSAVWLAGCGVGGVGGSDSGSYPRGTLRAGQNVIDSALTGLLRYDFDEPGVAPLGGAGEVMPAEGDSGGPTFIEIDGEMLLVGIHSFVTDLDGDSQFPEYGDYGYDVRVSGYSDWIAAQGQVPEPASLVTLLAGGMMLAGWKRRRGL